MWGGVHRATSRRKNASLNLNIFKYFYHPMYQTQPFRRWPWSWFLCTSIKSFCLPCTKPNLADGGLVLKPLYPSQFAIYQTQPCRRWPWSWFLCDPNSFCLPSTKSSIGPGFSVPLTAFVCHVPNPILQEVALVLVPMTTRMSWANPCSSMKPSRAATSKATETGEKKSQHVWLLVNLYVFLTVS